MSEDAFKFLFFAGITIVVIVANVVKEANKRREQLKRGTRRREWQPQPHSAPPAPGATARRSERQLELNVAERSLRTGVEREVLRYEPELVFSQVRAGALEDGKDRLGAGAKPARPAADGEPRKKKKKRRKDLPREAGSALETGEASQLESSAPVSNWPAVIGAMRNARSLKMAFLTQELLQPPLTMRKSWMQPGGFSHTPMK